MKRWQATLGISLAVCLAIGVVVYLSPHSYPFFDDDSTPYIEAGHNFANGRGFVTWPYGVRYFREEFTPLVVFPPGFPFLVSVGVRLGASAEAAATWIPRLCFVLMPWVLYRVFRFVMGRAPSAAAAAISVFVPPVVFHSMCAMSDIPFLLVVLLGFVALFRGLRLERRRWILIAGLVAGLAAGLRNAGYAVPVAVVVGFALGGAGRRLPQYLAGFAIGYAPIVLRNIAVFGKAQPYAMPPSGLAVGAVLREGLRAFDAVFVALSVPWPLLVPALAILVVGSTIWIVRAGRVQKPFAAQSVPVLCASVLWLYAAAGVSMILVTRLVFDVDPINPRFMVQYHWVFVGWCCLLVAEGLRTSRLRSRWMQGAAATVIAAVLLSPQVRVARTQIGHMSWARGVAAEHSGLRQIIATLPDDVCVVAFHAPQLHLMYDRPVYQLGDVSPAALSEFVGDEVPLVVVMFPFERELFHAWWDVFDGEIPAGYHEIGRSGTVIALERPRVPS